MAVSSVGTPGNVYSSAAQTPRVAEGIVVPQGSVVRVASAPSLGQGRVFLPSGPYDDDAFAAAQLRRRNDNDTALAALGVTGGGLAAVAALAILANRKRKATQPANESADNRVVRSTSGPIASESGGSVTPASYVLSAAADASSARPGAPPLQTPPSSAPHGESPTSATDFQGIVDMRDLSDPNEIVRVRNRLGVQEPQSGVWCGRHAAAALLDRRDLSMTEAQVDQYLREERAALRRSPGSADHSVREGGAAMSFQEQIAVYNRHLARLLGARRIRPDERAARPLAGMALRPAAGGRLNDAGADQIVMLTDSSVEPQLSRDIPIGPDLDGQQFPSVSRFVQNNSAGEGAPGAATARLSDVFAPDADRFEVIVGDDPDAWAGARSGLAAEMGHFVAIAHRGGAWRIVDSMDYNARDPQPLLRDARGFIRDRTAAGAARALLAYSAARGPLTHVRLATPYPHAPLPPR